METLQLASTAKTPFISFDPRSGKLEMKGKSIPENSKGFYQQVYDWLDQYRQNPQATTVFDIQLDYFNTSSAKCIADLFKKLEMLHGTGASSVTVNWHYNEDDGDMQEVGQDFQSLLKIPFNLQSFNL
jgi:hypothetical protein